MIKIPKLGQRVYLAFKDFIILDEVIMKGKSSFAISETFNRLVIEECRRPIYYKDYGIKWFTSFSEAKKSIKLNENECIIRCADNYWEIRNKISEGE